MNLTTAQPSQLEPVPKWQSSKEKENETNWKWDRPDIFIYFWNASQYISCLRVAPYLCFAYSFSQARLLSSCLRAKKQFQEFGTELSCLWKSWRVQVESRVSCPSQFSKVKVQFQFLLSFYFYVGIASRCHFLLTLSFP